MKKFNKMLSVLLCVILVVATCVATGCSSKDNDNNSTPTPTTAATTAPETTEAPVADNTTPETTEVPEITEAPVVDEITEAPVVDEITEAPEVTEAPVDETVEVIAVGEGATTFAFTCTDKDKNTTVFAVSTDKTTVGEALLDAGLVAGEESEYGLYVKEVNGIVADWDVDGTYWAFYIDGEYAMTGVDSTDINPDSVYSFVVE